MALQVLAQEGDGYVFRCLKCKRKKSVRSKSIFYNSRLSLRKLLNMCLAFVAGKSVQEAAAVCGLSHGVAVKWFAILRNVCSNALQREATCVGGPGVEVQVDETMVCHPK